MKFRLYIFFGICFVAGCLAFLWLSYNRQLPPITNGDRHAWGFTPPVPTHRLGALAGTPLTSSPPPNPSPSTDSKIAAIRAIWAEQNSQPQDFFGKVIDQLGLPVQGVTATATLMLIRGPDTPTENRTYIATSDANGCFEFTGLKGANLGVVVKKSGYEMGRGPGVYRVPNKEDKTSPSERAVLTLWKLKGAEPMIHKQIEAGLACDGSPSAIDLLTGRKVANGGDLTFTMIRTPLNIDPALPFRWSLTLTAVGGGLTEINDAYPNEAPANGYQPSITVTKHAGPPNFTGNMFDQSYYIKSRDGQVYGRMNVHVTSDYQPPPARLEIEVFANPAGSRNLEYSASKKAQ